jgi:ubiquinone biosynthesis protein UbiJ
MPATAPWVAAAESVINRGIAASSDAAGLARRLDATSLGVDVEGVMRLRASVHGGRLSLLPGDDEAADALISGSASALLGMLRGRADAAAATRGMQIRGNAEIANLYRELLTAARPDAEEELSRWIGDLPARHLAQLARRVAGWAQRGGATAAANLREYWQEESRDLISRTEADEFLQAVDAVRESADRIEARLANLESRLKAST